MSRYYLVALAIAAALLYFGRYLLPDAERSFLARPWVRTAVFGTFGALALILLGEAFLNVGLALMGICFLIFLVQYFRGAPISTAMAQELDKAIEEMNEREPLDTLSTEVLRTRLKTLETLGVPSQVRDRLRSPLQAELTRRGVLP